MAAPTLTLNNGVKIPVLGLGTWPGSDDPVHIVQAVKDAIDSGYRHFDTSAMGGGEKQVGKAIREKIQEGVVKREEIFVTTKTLLSKHGEKEVPQACKQSLENLGFEYIDLYLMNMPTAMIDRPDGTYEFLDITIEETWRGMEECYRLGYVKSIGISNFTAAQVQRIMAVAQIKPVINQIEWHVNFNRKKMRDFCAARGITITSYSPLGSPRRPWAEPGGPSVALDHPNIVEIGKKYGKTPAQVALRYLVDMGTVVIPKSYTKKRIQENIDIFDFKLTPEDIAVIDKLDRGLRVCEVEAWSGHKEYPFNTDF